MNNISTIAIFRERSHSPEREYDDEAILRETARKLASSGSIDVCLLSPEEFLEAHFDIQPALIFFMCEEAPYLARLREMAENTGCLLVNTVEAVENTFRKNMVAALKNQVFFPATSIHSISDALPSIHVPCWLKRGDYHAIDRDDVVFVRDIQSAQNALNGFASRDIGTVLIQEHVPGDIIKFYCIRDCQAGHTWWFKWFYHRDQDLQYHDFSADELMISCMKAGDIMGLDIYGGDAIVNNDGRIFIIDINAWPSFALYREEAAGFIARLIKTKLAKCLGASMHSKSGAKSISGLSDDSAVPGIT